MIRLFWAIVATFLVLSLLLAVGLVPAALVPVASWFVGTVWSLACPFTIFVLVWAPGLVRQSTEGFSQIFARIGARRRDVEDLERKIVHLDKAHHMAQLGGLFLRQGRYRQAVEWLNRALEKEPDMLDARYRLALCHFELKDYARAVELLELVYRQKPQYDYGLADLRLAQAHQRLGNRERASEVYDTLLRFYPGQPEGTYWYALLKAHQGDLPKARALMREAIFTVRHSPGFQRRRTRHWSLKAKWWLLRNGRSN